MKRYRLKQKLPTFEKGELFHTDENGNLWRNEGQNGNHWRKEVMAYNHLTIERFPDILTEWFEEYEERDPLSKEALIEYLRANPEQRLMQAVFNFINQKLNPNVQSLTVGIRHTAAPVNIQSWECDKMLLEASQQGIEEPEFTTFEDIEKRKKLDQMKSQLKEWAVKNEVTWATVYFGKYVGGTGDEFVRFRKSEDFSTSIEIRGWPRAGLKECEDYSIEYLLGTNKVNEK